MSGHGLRSAGCNIRSRTASLAASNARRACAARPPSLSSELPIAGTAVRRSRRRQAGFAALQRFSALRRSMARRLQSIASDPFQEADVKYGLGWLIGIPIPIIALWFLANQAGCGF